MGKLSKIINQLLPYLIIITFLILLLETIKFPGFFKKYFYIDAKVFFALTLTFIFIIKTRSNFLKRLFKYNQVLLPILVFFYIILNAIEGALFVNYVLATFQIHLDGLVLLVLFSTSLFLIDKFISFKPKSNGKLKFIYPTVIFLISLYLIKNLTYVVDQSFKRNFYILFHPLDSYDQKMSYFWDKFYNFMIFVKNNTPDDATILLPPMKDPWLQGSGNPHFVRAFLFPRKLIQIEDERIENPENFPPKTYILITWGTQECQPEGCHGWPRQDIPAKKIIYKDPDSTNTIETRTDATYKLEDDKYVYGIIEL